jgi:LCP family protein required for cell wall assembly
MVVGCLVVLLASAGAAAVFVLEQVHTFVQDISVNKPLNVSSRVLAASSYGRPETILFVGNDTRSVFKNYKGGYVPNLANEMLLVRFDPSKPWISMISLPRELWVNVTEPDGVSYTNRLNSAYTYGTTTLLRTIKRVTGLSVNHVIATTFTQFEHAINRLGCVYDTVDERYYHNNADGGDQYQNIDLQPGYQCMNGSAAEQFVSYRHTDTSQVRDSRDQSFLLAVKQQYGPRLAGNVSEFEKIFGESVRTDAGLRSPTEILHLADLLISAAGLRVRQVPFQTTPCDGADCPTADLTATSQQIRDSVHNFLFGGDVIPKRQVAAIGHRIHRRGGLAKLPLTATLSSNVSAEKTAAARLRLTAEFPRVQDLAGSADPVAAQCTVVMQPCIRSYAIRAPGGRAYPIYVEVFSNGDLGQYYDVQGTTWTGAPLVAHPTQTIRVGRRSYELFYDGGHLATVAWHQYGAVYWIHNTLTDAVSNGELLAIAEQTEPIGAIRRARTSPIPKVASVPVPSATTDSPAAAGTPLVTSAGRLGGLIAFLLLPVGLFLTYRNRRRLHALRERASTTATMAAALEQQLAAAAVPRPSGGPSTLNSEPLANTTAADATHSPFWNHGSRSRRLSVAVAVAVALAIVAVGVYIALGPGSPRHQRAAGTRLVPTARVAVLNAGRVPHAAHKLAARLARAHIHVAATGELTSGAPSGYEVVYAPGERRQAQLLTRFLRPHHVIVARADRAATRLKDSGAKLIVVIP